MTMTAKTHREPWWDADFCEGHETMTPLEPEDDATSARLAPVDVLISDQRRHPTLLLEAPMRFPGLKDAVSLGLASVLAVAVDVVHAKVSLSTGVVAMMESTSCPT